jgi:hypothetical protein
MTHLSLWMVWKSSIFYGECSFNSLNLKKIISFLGFVNLKLPLLDPFKLDPFNIDQGDAKSPLRVVMNFKNVDWIGMAKSVVTKVMWVLYCMKSVNLIKKMRFKTDIKKYLLRVNVLVASRVTSSRPPFWNSCKVYLTLTIVCILMSKMNNRAVQDKKKVVKFRIFFLVVYELIISRDHIQKIRPIREDF